MTLGTFLLCSLLQQQQNNMLQNPASVNHYHFDLSRLSEHTDWEKKSPRTALHFRKMLLSIIKHIMLNALGTHQNIWTQKLVFYNTVHKETSFKTTMITLHSVQLHSLQKLHFFFAFVATFGPIYWVSVHSARTTFNKNNQVRDIKPY